MTVSLHDLDASPRAPLLMGEHHVGRETALEFGSIELDPAQVPSRIWTRPNGLLALVVDPRAVDVDGTGAVLQDVLDHRPPEGLAGHDDRLVGGLERRAPALPLACLVAGVVVDVDRASLSGHAHYLAEVVATAAVLVDPEIGKAGDFDSVQVMLKTATGKQAMISNSRRATYGYDQRIEVHGSNGMVAAENQRPVSIEIASSLGYTRPPLHDFFMTRYTEAYAAEIATFIAALGGKGKAEPSGEDGLIALALADAAVKSVAEKRVVLVSEVL